MSPHFHGESYQFQCGQCNFRFMVPASQSPSDGTVICPNCAANNEWQSGTLTAADRGSVEQQPNYDRFDVVAFYQGSGPRTGKIKRILGLPHERLQFIDGNLVVNGSLVQKSWSDGESTLVPVFESNDTTWNRFVADDETVWSRDRCGWVFIAAAAKAESNRLTYHHIRCVKDSRHDRVHESGPLETPLEDYYGENQNLSRSFHAMDEACFSFEISLGAGGILQIQIAAFGVPWTCTLDQDGDSMELRRDADTVWSGRLPGLSSSGERRQLKIAFMDHQVFLITSNGALIAYSEPMPTHSGPFELPFLWFEAVRGTGAISNVGIARDLYYFDPRFTDGNTPGSDAWQIPEEGFFLVGDNVPLSKDSRQWEDPFIHRADVLGRFEMPRRDGK